MAENKMRDNFSSTRIEGTRGRVERNEARSLILEVRERRIGVRETLRVGNLSDLSNLSKTRNVFRGRRIRVAVDSPTKIKDFKKI